MVDSDVVGPLTCPASFEVSALPSDPSDDLGNPHTQAVAHTVAPIRAGLSPSRVEASPKYAASD